MKKILIVEDEIGLRDIIAEQFASESFEVLTAGDGVEGLDLALNQKPDIILLDIVMPKMDGLEMLKELRKDDWGKKAEVILLTNLSDSEKVAEAMENETYDYLVKSDWNIKDVVNLINKKMNK